PSCAGCHKLMDPIGLTLERFDGAGQLRTTEDGAAINVAGELDGNQFEGAHGLAATLDNDPAASSCIVAQAFHNPARRTHMPAERDWIIDLNQTFAADHYQFTVLLRHIAASPALYQITPETHSSSSIASGGHEEPRS